MQPLLKKIKIFDIVLIVVLLLCGIGSSAYIYNGNNAKKTVLIEVSGKSYGIYDLDTDRTIEIEGPQSHITVNIENGAVHVSESGCPQQICKRMGKKSRINDIIVCIPNRMIIRITGKYKKNMEFITQ